LPLETATFIPDLVASNPAASDPLSNADDHMRLIKLVLKNTFPGLAAALTKDGAIVIPWDGTGAAPAYSFASEPTLGLYRKASGVISVTGGRIAGTKYIGEIFDFAGPTAPADCMACDGQALSKTTYPDLFNVIGYTWGGSGDTFNLPPGKNRFRRHRDDTGLAGSVGTLQNPDVTSHAHAVVGNTGNDTEDHAHAFSGTTQGMNANNPHSHPVQNTTNIVTGNSTGSGVGGGGAFGPFQSPSVAFSIGNTDINHGHAFSGTTGGRNAYHTHPINLTTSAVGGSETRPSSMTVLTCIRVQ
jgi:microcystin-dependent protein